MDGAGLEKFQGRLGRKGQGDERGGLRRRTQEIQTALEGTGRKRSRKRIVEAGRGCGLKRPCFFLCKNSHITACLCADRWDPAQRSSVIKPGNERITAAAKFLSI